MRTKPDPAAFETFYQDVRSRLLLQTWALTGDLPAAQKAVRDALVIAWHHWAKVSRLEDPESFVRPQAWAQALRRHTARPFHRERGLDEEILATLASLAKLPLLQRKVLLLAHLTTLPLDQLAREAGITQARAERELQAATAAFALSRQVPTTGVLALFEPLAAELRDVRWPRTTILTRAGTARRRAHTGLGVVVALAAFAGSGFLVTEAGGARPSLDTLTLHSPASSSAGAPRGYPLSTDDLLTTTDVGASWSGPWTTEMTSDSADADATVLQCQPRGAQRPARAALARTFASGGDDARQAVEQRAQAAPDATAARSAYVAAVSGFAGCQQARVQLLATHRVSGVGDEAAQLVLQDWASPERTVVAGVARSGVLTTTVITAAPASDRGTGKASATNAALLAGALAHLCSLPGAGACTTRPETSDLLPYPVGEHPAMLDQVDLPPVRGVAQPWMATEPVAATKNLASTRCDAADFHGKGITGDLTRSFVIPAAKDLPAQFGLTETIGSFGTTRRASSFVDGVRNRVDDCSRRDLGTKVARLETSARGSRDLTVWRLTVEISKRSSIVYLMAIVREGSSVAQLGFVPSGSATVSEREFVALAHRAAERLTRLR